MEKPAVKHYGKVEFDAETGLWKITCEPHAMIRLKGVFPRINPLQMGTVTLLNTPRACTEILWFCDLYPLLLTADVERKLMDGREVDRRTIKLTQETLSGIIAPREFKLALTPRSYQAVGTELWLQRKALLITDEMGLGKTLQALAGFTQQPVLPALAVVKVGLIPQWVREAKRCVPGIRVHVLEGRKIGQIPPADLYVTAYTRIHAWAETMAPLLNAVVFDEIQELRHRDTGKYSGALHISRAIEARGGYRLGLSGSPIYNYGDDMFSALDLLEEGCLGSEFEFGHEWCESFGRHIKVRDTTAFGRYLLDQGLMLRRTRKDVAIELPPRTRIVETIEADPAVLGRDESMAIELAKIVLTSSSFTARGEAARQFDLKLRQATGIAKAPYVAAFARMLLEQGERVIITAWHREVYTVLLSQLADFKPVMFTGSESAKEKEESLTAFKTGDSRVLLLSLRSSEGIDGLQFCCATVINAELDWTAQVHEQCVTRVDRPGQTKPTMEIFLVSEEGSDPTIARINGVKREQSEGILNPFGQSSNTPATDAARVKSMAREFLKRRGIVVREPAAEDELPLEEAVGAA